jgi:hypothetical protein
MRAPTWREYRVLDVLMHVECRERPVTLATLANEARLDMKDAEQAVNSLVAKGFLDIGAVPWVASPPTSPR